MKITLKSVYKSAINSAERELNRIAAERLSEAGKIIKEEIKRRALLIKKTGNLAKGAYSRLGRLNKGARRVYAGIRAPGYHNYLIEYGHLDRSGKFVSARPVVYPSFADKAQEVKNVIGSTWIP